MWIDGISGQLSLGLTWPDRCQFRPHRGRLQVWKGPGHDFIPEAGGVDPDYPVFITGCGALGQHALPSL